jgi:acyl-CoA synthetase (AMP-forming)/AMP-acid ligase II
MNLGTLLDITAVIEPDRVAIGDARSGVTHAHLRDLARRAGRLFAGDPDRPVLFAGTATLAFPVALFGAALAGRPFAPLSYRLAAEPLAELVADQAPAVLVADERTIAALPARPDVLTMTPAAFLDRVRATAPDDAEPEPDPGRPAVLLHTSGTSGRPKVAVLRHHHLTSYVLGTTEVLTAGADEAALVSVPPYHIAGVAGMLTGLYCGRRIVQLVDTAPAAWVDAVREQRVTHAMVVPTVLARVLDELERTGERLPSLRHLSYGGGRMPLAVIEHALRFLPHVAFVNGYGLTETTSSIAVLGPEDHRVAFGSDDPAVRRRLGSVGRALPTVEIVVRDVVGERPLPAGEHGELWVRGPQVSGEYAAAGARDTDGWFRTRDAGWMDDAGYIFVEGRLDDVIVRGGENLSPGEIEDVLAAHPDVGEVVVYGIPDLHWGEVAAASVVLAPGSTVTADDLQRWVAGRLRSSRVPAVVRFHDALPRNDMGKLLRRVLKAETASQYEAQQAVRPRP